MHIFSSFPNADDIHHGTSLAMTIGNFDGVHRGHQEMLRHVVEEAQKRDLIPSVMTFSPHVREFFTNEKNFLISSEADKTAAIEAEDIQYLYNIAFNEHLANLSPEDFVDVLVERLRVRYLLVGDDFRFGQGGRGDVRFLQKVMASRGIDVEITPTVTSNGQRISSSLVRESIRRADFSTVTELLNRPLSYTGVVSTGKQLGRTINFPTANVSVPEQRLLPAGVFAVTITIEGAANQYYGMSNIGTKPTVDDSKTRNIETHIFDFNGDIYGKRITITPVMKLRDEQRFSGIDALMQQLALDKQQALTVFN